MIRLRLAVALCAALAVNTGLVLALAGVAGAAPAGSSVEETDDEPVATLEIIEDTVSVRRGGKDEFKEAKDGKKLRVGDTVQTDETGFAQINYTDDSFTRLDVNTTFTIESLTDDEGNRQVEGSLDTGRTWNRTTALTESESFEQEGAGATAAVVGTAFLVTCTSPGNCVFTAVVDGVQLTTVDGELQPLDPLEECDATEVDDTNSDLCNEPSQVELDALIADAWIAANLFLDGLAGYPGPVVVEGTIVVEGGQVVSFTPAPQSQGSQTPPPPDVEQGAPIIITDPAPGGPTSSIETDEHTDVVFMFNVSPLAGTFITFNNDILSLPGVIYYTTTIVENNKVNPNEAGQYSATEEFTFVPEEVASDEGPATFHFVATNEGGASQEGSVDVTVTDTDVCVEGEGEGEVEAAC